MFFARALYKNVADTPDELSFSQGDVLEVIETEVNGAPGWWLCSYKGKIGIAPGNRLHVLSATDGSSRGASPSGAKLPFPVSQMTPLSTDAKQSWNHQSDNMGFSQKSDNSSVYDNPLRVLQDYDVPPVRYDRKCSAVSNRPATPQSNPLPAVGKMTNFVDNNLENYDVPSALRITASPMMSETYDMLPGFVKHGSRLDGDASMNSCSLTYDVPPALPGGLGVPSEGMSNRSSILSILSTGSRSSACSGHSSHNGSASTRSSVVVSAQNLYDIPSSSLFHHATDVGRSSPQQHVPSSRNFGDGAKTRAAPNQQQIMLTHLNGDVHNIYPLGNLPSSLKINADRDSYLEDYSVPRFDESQSSGDSGISMSSNGVEQINSRSSSGVILDELYDTPKRLDNDEHRSNATRCEVGVKLAELLYDIPCQISMGISGGAELSIGDAGDYMGLQSKSPADILASLESNVVNHATKLIALINETLLAAKEPDLELSQIKLTCLTIKTALKEFVEFGNGILNHASNKCTDRNLSERVSVLLDKVRTQLQFLSKHIDKLIMTQWPAIRPKRRMAGEITDLEDNLNTIKLLTECMPMNLMTLTSFVLQNSSTIFHLVTTNETLVPCSDQDLDGKGLRECGRQRPPLPPLTKSKSRPGQDMIEKAGFVQDRPLPPVPMQMSINKTSGIENSHEWNDECDYVSIANEAEEEMKRSLGGRVGREVSMITGKYEREEKMEHLLPGEKKERGLSPVFRERLEAVQKSSTANNSPNQSLLSLNDSSSFPSSISLNETRKRPMRNNDYEFMAYYSGEVATHFAVVESTARELFQILSSDQLNAKEFVLRSKFLILAAHKIVYISDAITRNDATSSLERNQISASANELCDLLKETVTATKLMALHLMQNEAQWRMIECIKAVVQASAQLCDVIRVTSAHS